MKWKLSAVDTLEKVRALGVKCNIIIGRCGGFSASINVCSVLISNKVLSYITDKFEDVTVLYKADYGHCHGSYVSGQKQKGADGIWKGMLAAIYGYAEWRFPTIRGQSTGRFWRHRTWILHT